MKLVAQFAGNRYSAKFRRMLQLPMTSPLPHDAPAVSPQQIGRAHV